MEERLSDLRIQGEDDTIDIIDRRTREREDYLLYQANLTIMEDILQNFLTLGTVADDPREYDRELKSLVKDLNELPIETILHGLNKSGDLLKKLQPDVQSIPYLYALRAHINAVGIPNAPSLLGRFDPSSELWRLMEVFMECFDAVQIRYTGHELRRLIEKVIETAYECKVPSAAVQPVKTAMLRIDPSGATLTSTHTMFVRLCLHAKAVKDALAIIENDIWHFPVVESRPGLLPCSTHETSSTYVTVTSGLSARLTYQEILQYYLFAAMIHMMRKNWEAASDFLEIVIEWPTNNLTSMIQVKAYEKWVLVGLLLNGKPSPMPSDVKGSTAKDLRAICKPYDTLADVYKEGDRAKLEAEVRAGTKLWQESCNMGLVNQVIDSLRYHVIKNLGKTYMSISLVQVANDTAKTSAHPNDVAETQRYVQAMIDKGQLNASITPTGFLRIARSSWEGPLARSEAEHLQDLAKVEEKIKAANVQIQAANRRFSLNPAYVAETRKSRKAKEKDFEGPSESEDMLADM